MQRSDKFPLVKITRLRVSTSRTPEMISRWHGNNGTVLDKSCFLDLDLHTGSNNFASDEVQRGGQSLRSCCLQRIKTQGIMIMIATESKSKRLNEHVNNDEIMDRGLMMF